MGRKANKKALFISTFCFLLLSMESTVQQVKGEDQDGERDGILTRAESVHNRLYPAVRSRGKKWISAQAQKIGQGQSDWEAFRVAVFKKGRHNGMGEQAILFHTAMEALSIVKTDIIRHQSTIEQVDIRIMALEKGFPKRGQPSRDQQRKMELLSNEHQRLMVLLQHARNRRQNLLTIVSNIVKTAGNTEQAIINNLK